MNNNYLIIKKSLSKVGNKKIATGFALMGLAAAVLAVGHSDSVNSFLTTWTEIFGPVLLFLSGKYIFDGYKSLKAVQNNKVLLAIERGDTSAILIIQKILNQNNNAPAMYNIAMSAKDGSKHILEPSEKDLNLVFNSLKQAFPNAYVEK